MPQGRLGGRGREFERSTTPVRLLEHGQCHAWPERATARDSHAGGGSNALYGAEDGYILTNSHLVDRPGEVEVTLQDGRQFKARVIGADTRSDIAAVKIKTRHLPTVPGCETWKVRVGDLVLAVGNPFGVGQTVAHGIVSATDQTAAPNPR